MLAATTAGCAADSELDAVANDATELWSEPDDQKVTLLLPTDYEVSSSSTVWVADRALRLVRRIGPPRGTSAALGLGEGSEGRVLHPARIAVGEHLGIFVFDLDSEMVELYTLQGRHLWGFKPGFKPSVLEFSRKPIGLTFGLVEWTPDSIPHLVVIHTDSRGEGRDTLLGPYSGPEPLRMATATSGSLSVDAAESGLWIWARSVPDTVFEVTKGAGARKLVLREADRDMVGILVDLEESILWTVSPPDTAGVRYTAFSMEGHGVIDGADAYLGERVTPPDFTPRAAREGAVFGWKRPSPTRYLAASFDMHVDRLHPRPAASSTD